jgi:Tfp pilus assembly protein PilF
MKKIVKGLAGLFLIFMNFPLPMAGQEKIQREGIREGYESEYYYAFTEATRYMIYQYYNQAVGLYKTCLEYNPGSAAIKYQLSKIYYRTGYIEDAKKLGLEAWNGERENRWYLLNLITIYQTTNRIDSAILFEKELIALEPGKVGNYLNLSVLYEISREYRKSLKILDQVEINFGKSVEVLTLKYDIYKSMGNKGQAVSQLYSAHEMEPDNVSVVGLIAEFYRDNRDQDSASTYYNYLLKMEERDPVTVFSYIDYLISFIRYEEALQYFVTAIKKEIVNKEQTAGYFMNKLEQYEDIIQKRAFYDGAIAVFDSLYSTDLRVNALYVDYNFKVKNYENVAEKLKIMLKTNERNNRIWEQLLFTENIINQYDSLLFYGEKAVYLFDDQPLPYLYTGIAYLQKKEYSLALKNLEKGFKYAGNKEISLQYCIFIAEAYNGLQNHDKSFEFYEKALSVDSTNSLIMNNYAYFLAVDGKDLEKAEKMSRKTIQKEKTNAIYLDTYAWILYKMDDIRKAKYYIKKAMKYGGGSDKEITEHYNTILNLQSEQEN